RGASLTSYALLVGLVAVLAIGVVANTGGEIKRLFGQSADSMQSVAGGAGPGTGSGDGGNGNDGGGGPAPQAPTDISLSQASVNEGESVGTAVGTFTATDADSGSHSFELVSGALDNASFSI